jgi:hypothetical protein
VRPCVASDFPCDGRPCHTSDNYGFSPVARQQRTLDCDRCSRDVSATAFDGTFAHNTDTRRAFDPCESAYVTRDDAVIWMHMDKFHTCSISRLRAFWHESCKCSDLEILGSTFYT